MEKINNKDFYKKSIRKYGISAQGVHWNNKYTQYKRFEVLTKFIKKDIKNATIIDAGCGFGEYYKYLKNNHFLAKKYIAYDCEDMMIDEAKKRFKNIEFIKKDILKDQLDKVDYYVCSGALSILNKQEVYLFIKRCYSHSNKGFVFNILKNFSFNNINIDELLEFCKTLTTNIKTKDNYLDNDFTIFMIK